MAKIDRGINMRKIDRTGEVAYNNFGSKMIIKEYRNANDIDVHFEKYNWISKNKKYHDFKKGDIRCPYDPIVFGVGYTGEGIYKVKTNNKNTKHYSAWYDMLKRCYDSKYIQQHPTYTGCEVYSLWRNFQVFAGWVDENYYEIEGERMALDKDILCKGNKIYSPDTCVFVPTRINSLFTKRDKCRGDLPIGVVYDKSRGKYMGYCDVNGQQKHLGRYKTPNEAFQAYKNFKEQYIKEVAEEYKEKIPQKLYDIMIKYEVEIND